MSGRPDSRDLGDAVGRVGFAKRPGPQIDGAGRGAKQKRVAIPVLGRDGEGGIRTGKPLDAASEADLANLFQFAGLASSVYSRPNSRTN